MELEAFEVHVYAKTETRRLEMACLVKITPSIASAISLSCFKASHIELKLVFNNLTFQHMDALRKQIQSPVENVLNHSFWT